MSKPSECFPQVCTQGPNICPFWASNPKYQILSVDMPGKKTSRGVQAIIQTVSRYLLSTMNSNVGKEEHNITCLPNCAQCQTGILICVLVKALLFHPSLLCHTSFHHQPGTRYTIRKQHNLWTRDFMVYKPATGSVTAYGRSVISSWITTISNYTLIIFSKHSTQTSPKIVWQL